jgi:hypothetical protein
VKPRQQERNNTEAQHLPDTVTDNELLHVVFKELRDGIGVAERTEVNALPGQKDKCRRRTDH